MALWTGFSIQFWNRLLTLAETKGFFSKKSKWSYFEKRKKKKILVLKQNGFHLLSTRFRLNPTSFRSRSDLKLFTVAAILDFRTERFKQFWISILPRCLKFQLNLTKCLGGDVVWRFYNFYPKMLVTDIITGDYTGSATEAITYRPPKCDPQGMTRQSQPKSSSFGVNLTNDKQE